MTNYSLGDCEDEAVKTEISYQHDGKMIGSRTENDSYRCLVHDKPCSLLEEMQTQVVLENSDNYVFVILFMDLLQQLYQKSSV